MGVAIVEFLQSWKLVEKPLRELLKILLVILVSFICGTLPFLSNFQLLVSMFTGAITSVIILPYVTFGHWNEKFRKILVGISIPILLLMTFIIIFVFYRVQTLQHCQSCQFFECIPYTTRFCLTGYWSFNEINTLDYDWYTFTWILLYWYFSETLVSVCCLILRWSIQHKINVLFWSCKPQNPNPWTPRLIDAAVIIIKSFNFFNILLHRKTYHTEKQDQDNLCINTVYFLL